MSAPRKPRVSGNRPANDNEGPSGRLKAELSFPPNLPVQLVEVEVLAALLDSLPPPANDNEG